MRGMLYAITLLALAACGGIVRDRVVYETELDQYHAWATREAAFLRAWLPKHCVCQHGRQPSQECQEVEDLILTIESRADWHRAMSLHLAGLQTHPGDPPLIPPVGSLCEDTP